MSQNLQPYAAFGKTKLVPVKIYVDAEFQDNHPTWEHILWVERGEDWYAFSSLKGKRVRVVTREDWIKAKDLT